MECSPAEAREFLGREQKVEIQKVEKKSKKHESKNETPWTVEELEILADGVLKGVAGKELINLPVLLDRHSKGAIYYKLHGMKFCNVKQVGRENWNKLISSGTTALLERAKATRQVA